MPPASAPKAPPSITLGGLTLTYVEGEGVSAKVGHLLSKPLDPAETFTLAEWLRSRSHEEDEVRKFLRYAKVRHTKQDEKRELALFEFPRRYWFGFFTTRPEPRGRFPFPVWVAPATVFPRLGDRALVTLIESVRAPLAVVLDYWSDAKERFCAVKEAGWEPPADKFPPQPSEASP